MHARRRRWDGLCQLFERAVQPDEVAIKGDAHLVRERPAGHIVRGRRRRAGSRKKRWKSLMPDAPFCSLALPAVAAATTLGVIVQLSRPPRSMPLWPMSQLL